jgi:hypothetical protein
MIYQGEQFIKTLKRYKGKKAILECIDKEVKSLNDRTLSLGSLKKYFTKYRNMFREIYANNTIVLELLLSNFKLDEEKSKKLKEQTIKQINEDHNNLRKIKDVKKFVDIGKELLESPYMYSKLLGVAALTGRRVGEIGCTGRFELVEKKGNYLKFFGQLKMKGCAKDKGYIIPVLCDPKKIIKQLQIIREEKKSWINETTKFNAGSSKALGVKVRKSFLNVVEGEIKVKDLRAIYAEISYSNSTNVKISKNAYFSKILGHSVNDLITCNSYIDFYI